MDLCPSLVPRLPLATDTALRGADREPIGTGLVYSATETRFRDTDRQLVETNHVHIVADLELRSADRELIETDHALIVTDAGPVGTDRVTIFIRLRRNATRDPVCGLAEV